MAKNTNSAKFRKVDVDQYDEDRYVDEEGADADGEGPNESEVTNLINQKKHQEALAHVLKNAPIGSKSQAVKDRATNQVIRVLSAHKQNEIEPSVKSLDSKELDTLMKYVYRGFETPTDNSSQVLLTWHEKVFAAGGLGCIMRVMTDRKRV